MQWLRVGDRLINLNQVAHVNLALQAGANPETGEKARPYVEVVMTSLARDGSEIVPDALYFSGDEADAVRSFFAEIDCRDVSVEPPSLSSEMERLEVPSAMRRLLRYFRPRADHSADEISTDIRTTEER